MTSKCCISPTTSDSTQNFIMEDIVILPTQILLYFSLSRTFSGLGLSRRPFVNECTHLYVQILISVNPPSKSSCTTGSPAPPTGFDQSGLVLGTTFEGTPPLSLTLVDVRLRFVLIGSLSDRGHRVQ